ncbi:hypothetical protein [Thiomonas sp.]|jgi:hypothetical protein|uniref:hypothetical protein n=1 Tax=Thiomonas sp. TaxID=2047785 RepID=UPI00263134C7|nr:hypothetical protein [Thiomonas sp.]
MFQPSIEEPPLWSLGVRIECADDIRLLSWLVRRYGERRVRAAASRRELPLAPRPQGVAADLEVRRP